MQSSPFSSYSALEQAFVEGLATLLDQHDGLGVYILCLANAAYDPALWPRLRPLLNARHQRHAQTLTAALRQGERLLEPEDDLLVFLKLMAIGFENVRTTLTRQVGPWQLQFNPIRALRPPRASGIKMETLLRPFDASGFHFNKPFLAKEVLWQGALADKPARLLYNKFPFAPLHGLLVPEPDRTLPQYLTPELHGWAWQVSNEAASCIPGFGLAYNSLGAQASVNHLHFQSFVATQPLPLFSAEFTHQGGHIAYPLPCQVEHSPEEAWMMLDELHQGAQPYNLVYSPGQVHILPRQAQGNRPVPAWSAGLGWSELAGLMTVFSQEDFELLGATDIALALSELQP